MRLLSGIHWPGAVGTQDLVMFHSAFTRHSGSSFRNVFNPVLMPAGMFCSDHFHIVTKLSPKVVDREIGWIIMLDYSSGREDSLTIFQGQDNFSNSPERPMRDISLGFDLSGKIQEGYR